VIAVRSFSGGGSDYIQGWTEPRLPGLLLQNVVSTVRGALSALRQTWTATVPLTEMRTRRLQRTRPTPGSDGVVGLSAPLLLTVGRSRSRRGSATLSGALKAAAKLA